MGFFSDVGRTVERVKQSVTGDPTGYRCTACGAVHDAAHDHCPDCGEPAVEAMEPEGEEPTGDPASDDPED